MGRSLLEVQQELTRLEKQAEALVSALKELHQDVAELRAPGTAGKWDFDAIDLKARSLPLVGHPLGRETEEAVRRFYMVGLLSLIGKDSASKHTEARLILAQRIYGQAGLTEKLKDLYIDSLQLNTEFFGTLQELVTGPLAESFLVDAVMIANLGGQARDSLLQYVGELAVLLNVSKEKLTVLAALAKAALEQCLPTKGRELAESVLACAKDYPYYLPEHICEAKFKPYRTVALALGDSFIHDFKWKSANEASVKKGDVLATWDFGGRGFLLSQRKTKQATAPCGGTVYHFKEEKIYYAVIGLAGDNKDSIKAWVRQQVKDGKVKIENQSLLGS